MMNMYSLSANVLVRDHFVYRAESLLTIGSDRKSEELTPYIDFKSERLRNILREALHDIKDVSLMEDKPSIIETDITFAEHTNLNSDRAKCAFYFLLELGKCVERIKNNSERESIFPKHPSLLIDYLKHKYVTIL